MGEKRYEPKSWAVYGGESIPIFELLARALTWRGLKNDLHCKRVSGTKMSDYLTENLKTLLMLASIVLL